MQYYGPDYELDVRPSNMDNANTAEYLEKIKNQVIDNIRRTMHKPSVQMTDIPSDIHGMDDEADAIMNDEDEEMNTDTRHSARQWDLQTEKDGELSDSEDENAKRQNGVKKTRSSRRNIMNYQNLHAVPDDDEIISNLGVSVEAQSGANGESKSSVASPTPTSSHPSPPTANAVDGDVDMVDRNASPVLQASAAEGPQAVTPPESPQSVQRAPANEDVAEDIAAEEQTTVIEDREAESATAEQSAEPAAASEA